MNAHDDKKIRKLLQDAFPPVDDAGPPRDLWPQVLGRLDEAPARVPWFDWVLAGVLATLLVLSPEVIPALFYYL
jgi:anti-sigma factor RsiW